MSDVRPFPQGRGPHGPDLDQRVAKLEEDVNEIKDLSRDHQQALTDVQVKLGSIDGRLAGLDARVGALPTTWTILGIIFTTWALGSGILIFAMNFIRP